MGCIASAGGIACSTLAIASVTLTCSSGYGNHYLAQSIVRISTLHTHTHAGDFGVQLPKRSDVCGQITSAKIAEGLESNGSLRS